METAELKGEARGRAEGLAEGRAKGLAEGRAQGRVEGLVEGIRKIAADMKSKGFSTDTIVELTGLSAAEIEVL